MEAAPYFASSLFDPNPKWIKRGLATGWRAELVTSDYTLYIHTTTYNIVDLFMI